MQNELTQPGKLLTPQGRPAQVGWSRQPMLDTNLEDVHFYALRFLQPLRVKRWDYYATFTPTHFFSATVADLGYAGNVFVYILDFESGELHEEGLVIPLGRGIELPRNSTQGRTHFADERAQLTFDVQGEYRQLNVNWPAFNEGRGICADLRLHRPPEHESMTLVIPIGEQRFYYNRKINCLPTAGQIVYGDLALNLTPETCLSSLDWGRGVWEYSSFWNWASASGYLPDGRSLGLNLGEGFGDTSQATENAFILDGVVHKLDQVPFDYTSGDYMQPWHFRENQGRLDLTFTPFKDRTAATRLLVIDSEVHQMFGRYDGYVVTDDGERIEVNGLIGFAEEHHARW